MLYTWETKWCSPCRVWAVNIRKGMGGVAVKCWGFTTWTAGDEGVFNPLKPRLGKTEERKIRHYS